MAKLAVFVIAIIFIALWWLSGKITRNKLEEKKPFINSSLDEKLDMLKKELNDMEKTLPFDLATHQEQVRKIKEEIEHVKELKIKFEK